MASWIRHCGFTSPSNACVSQPAVWAQKVRGPRTDLWAFWVQSYWLPNNNDSATFLKGYSKMRHWGFLSKKMGCAPNFGQFQLPTRKLSFVHISYTTGYFLLNQLNFQFWTTFCQGFTSTTTASTAASLPAGHSTAVRCFGCGSFFLLFSLPSAGIWRNNSVLWSFLCGKESLIQLFQEFSGKTSSV